MPESKHGKSKDFNHSARKRQQRENPSNSFLRHQKILLKETETKLPEGLEFNNEEERKYWEVYSKSRLPDDWKYSELCMLKELCEVKVKADYAQKVVNKLGEVYLNDRGTYVVNPYFQVQQQHYRMFVKLAAMLNLTVKVGLKEMLEKTEESKEVEEKQKIANLPFLASANE